MNERTIDTEGTRYSLKLIFATFGMIMEDLEQEHEQTKGYEASFHARMDDVYIPALNLMLCSIQGLLDEMEAAV